MDDRNKHFYLARISSRYLYWNPFLLWHWGEGCLNMHRHCFYSNLLWPEKLKEYIRYMKTKFLRDLFYQESKSEKYITFFKKSVVLYVFLKQLLTEYPNMHNLSSLLQTILTSRCARFHNSHDYTNIYTNTYTNFVFIKIELFYWYIPVL